MFLIFVFGWADENWIIMFDLKKYNWLKKSNICIEEVGIDKSFLQFSIPSL